MKSVFRSSLIWVPFLRQLLNIYFLTSFCSPPSFFSPPPLSYPHLKGWGSAADWQPPPGCLWCCSCLWGAGDTRTVGPSSDVCAEHDASSAELGIDQLAAGAAGSGSTAPKNSASGTSRPPGETPSAMWSRGRQIKLNRNPESWDYRANTHFSTWTGGVLLFSASCLKDKKAARGVHAGLTKSSSSSSSLSSSPSLLLPAQHQMNKEQCSQ